MKRLHLFVFLCAVFGIFRLIPSAAAQVPDEITGLSLKETALTLRTGETYVFEPEITTRVVSGISQIGLNLYSSDENVVRVTGALNTIEAVGGGAAEVRVYTAGYEFSAVCRVTVRGEPKSLVPKGLPWEAPSAEELAKVHAPSLKSFLEMIASPEMDATASPLAAKQLFRMLVSTAPGTAAAVAEQMRALGMDPVHAFTRIDTVSAQGTAEQFRDLLGMEEVLSIDEDALSFAGTADAGRLEGQAETLSHFSAAYGMGLDGSGTVIAVIDSGVYPEHEQFTGKEDSGIIRGACFTQESGTMNKYTLSASCANGTGEDRTSGWIGPEMDPAAFFHGTHVASIAAGKDGVAPKADLISVNVFTRLEYACTVSGEKTTCHGTGSLASDHIRAFEYLNELMDSEGIRIAAINMSLGSGRSTKSCPSDRREAYVKDFLSRGIITTVAAGNEAYDGGVSIPACMPSAFAVGALRDSGTPQVAPFSNHSDLVSILAPGTGIVAAVTGSPDAYEPHSGTSMAAPVAAGAVALLRQKYPDASAKVIRTLLTEMTDRTAARNKITKPVLDLANLPAAVRLLDSGPSVNVYGGDGFVRVDLGTVPLNVKYVLKLDTVPAGSKPVKTYTRTGLTTYRFTNLKNGRPYTVTMEYTVTGIRGTRTMTVPAMPMDSAGYTLGWSLPAGAGSDPDAKPVIEFGWTPAENSVLTVRYSQNGTSGTTTAEGASAEWDGAVFDKTVTAEFSRTVTIGSAVYRSVPQVLKTLPLGPAVPNFADAFNGKVYLNFDTPPEGLTGRQVRLVRVETNAAGEEVLKPQTPVTCTVKKAPTDIVLTGIKNGTRFYIETRNYMTIGKTTRYGAWYRFSRVNAQGVTESLFRMEVPAGGVTGKDPELSGVTVSAGNGSVTVKYRKNLIADGYQFVIKPVEPDRAVSSVTAAAKNARESYTIKNLKNGTVYKLRLRWYTGSGKKTSWTGFYPDADINDPSDTWDGIYFIPMPAPSVTRVNSDGTFVLQSDGSVDRLAIIRVSGTDPSDTEVLYRTVVKGQNLIDPELTGDESSVILMYAKEYKGTLYYGPSGRLMRSALVAGKK